MQVSFTEVEYIEGRKEEIRQTDFNELIMEYILINSIIIFLIIKVYFKIRQTDFNELIMGNYTF